MKFSFLHLTVISLTLLAVVAGCSSTPPVQVSPAPTPAPEAIPTRTLDPVLLSLILSPEEVPFTVANEKSQIPDLLDPLLSEFGAVRGYTRYVINQKTDSPSAVQLGQMIVEYPTGNATRAFTRFVEQNRKAAPSQYVITWLPDPKIGDESVALTINDATGSAKPMAMVVFRKSRYMESVVMISPAPLDTDTLVRTARLAAARIPA